MLAAKTIHNEGLVVATSGNVSARLNNADGGTLMAVTATSVGYDQMQLSDVVVVDLEGEPVLGDAVPSSESMMHSAIYSARPDVGAVVHTHSIYASAAGIAGASIPALIDEMVLYLGDSIHLAEYAPPATVELAMSVVRGLGERNAVLLRNHGAVAVGSTIREALNACRLVEHLAHIYMLAQAAGGIHVVPESVVSTELALFRMRAQLNAMSIHEFEV